jgi:peptidoglycan/LPS O-acetylase OafA/YrhL
MNNKTKYITGLKALGAIMVVISHLKMQFSNYTDLTWKLITFPAYFILLFVCISAFTISMSLDKRTEFNLVSYMKRRWVRLAPSYYAILLIGLTVKTLVQGWGYFQNTVTNLPFLFLFLNLDPIHTKSQSSILGVEWMLPILFWFYLFIPLVLWSAKKFFPIFLLLFSGSIFLHFNPTIITTYNGFGGFGWSMQFYIVMYTFTIFIYVLHQITAGDIVKKLTVKKCVYAVGSVLCLILLLFYIHSTSERIYGVALLGITGYLLWIKIPLMESVHKNFPQLTIIIDNLDIVLLGVILIKYMINLYFIQDPHIILTLWFVALLMAGIHRPLLSRLLFENKPMQFLGLISFGMYLTHPLAIIAAERTIPMQLPWVRVALIFPLTIFLSYVLYRYIEEPIRKRFS